MSRGEREQAQAGRASLTENEADADGDAEQHRALVMRRRAVQRKARVAAGTIKSALAESQATRAPSPLPSSGGAPLPRPVRANMESSLGADFSSVRVHQGGEAEAMGALAYTQGEELHFRPGHYDPASQSGRELIGHELTHVVQQRAGRVSVPQGKGAPVNADEGLEAEADAAGARAARGERAELPGSGGGVARDGHAPAQRKAAPIQRYIYVGKGETKPLKREEIKDDVMKALETKFADPDMGTLLRAMFEQLLTQEFAPDGMTPLRVESQEKLVEALMAALAGGRGDAVQKKFKPGDKLYGTQKHRQKTLREIPVAGGPKTATGGLGGLRGLGGLKLGGGGMPKFKPAPDSDDEGDFAGLSDDDEDRKAEPKDPKQATASAAAMPAAPRADHPSLAATDAKKLDQTPNRTVDEVNKKINVSGGQLQLDAEEEDDELRADGESTEYAKWLNGTKRKPDAGRKKGKNDSKGSANIAASCKAMIAYTTKEAKKQIHFELDMLDLARIVSKDTQAVITGQELRYVYRQYLAKMDGLEAEADVERVVFYLNGEEVRPPWLAEPELWEKYRTEWRTKHRLEIEAAQKARAATASGGGLGVHAALGSELKDGVPPPSEKDVKAGMPASKEPLVAASAEHALAGPAGHDTKEGAPKPKPLPVAPTVTVARITAGLDPAAAGAELGKLVREQARDYVRHLVVADWDKQFPFVALVNQHFGGEPNDLGKHYEAWRSGKPDSPELRVQYLTAQLAQVRTFYTLQLA